jgi:beta-lactamase regulating signal transducer with metallopeptidase domain
MKNFIEFPQNLIDILGWTVFHAIWQGAIIGLVFYFLLTAQCFKSSKARFNAAWATLFMQLLSSVTTFFYIQSTFQNNLDSSVNQAISIQNNIYLSGTESISQQTSLLEKLLNLPNQYIDWISWVWLIGVSLMSLRLLGGFSYLFWLNKVSNSPLPIEMNLFLEQKRREAGLKRIIGKLSSHIQSPIVFGHFKPILLFPVALLSKLTPEQVEAVIIHELAHVKRNDYILNIFQIFIEIIFYFHPVTWWLTSIIKREREHICDDEAAGKELNQKLSYAKALLIIQENDAISSIGSLAFAKKPSEMYLRIKRILEPSKNVNFMEKTTLGILVLGLAVGMFWQQKPVYANKSEFKTLLTVKTDSLPKGTIQLNLNKNGKTWDINLKDGKIVSLKKDGNTIPESDFPKYESDVKKIVSEMPPPPPPGLPAPPPPPGVPAPPPPPTIIKMERIDQTSGNNPEDAIIIVKKDGSVHKFIQHKEVTVKREGQNMQSEEKIIWKDEKGNNVNLEDIDPATIKTMNVIKSPKSQKSETTTVTVITSEKNTGKTIIGEEIKGIDVRKSINGEEVIIFNGRQLNGLKPLNGLMEGKELFVADSINFSLGNYTFQPGNVRSAITNQLMSDQIITDDKNFQMELTSSYLKIDGKKFVGPFHAKYLKIYESNTGLKMDSKSKISISGKE